MPAWRPAALRRSRSLRVDTKGSAAATPMASRPAASPHEVTARVRAASTLIGAPTSVAGAPSLNDEHSLVGVPVGVGTVALHRHGRDGADHALRWRRREGTLPR